MGNPRKRSLVDCSPWGRKRVRHDIVMKQQESPTWWCAFPGVTPRSMWCLCWPLQVTLILHIQKVLSSSIVWLQIFFLATSKESWQGPAERFWHCQPSLYHPNYQLHKGERSVPRFFIMKDPGASLPRFWLRLQPGLLPTEGPLVSSEPLRTGSHAPTRVLPGPGPLCPQWACLGCMRPLGSRFLVEYFEL